MIKLTKKSEQEEDPNEDYDFDFSIYDQEEKEDKEVDTIIRKDEVPKVTLYKSKFSTGIEELQQLSELSNLMKKYGIKVEERRQDIKELWRLYGVLSEYWACVTNIFGKLTIDEIDHKQKIAYDALKKHRAGRIDFSVHEKLLDFRKILYRARHFVNLTFETERKYRGEYQKASAQIKQ